MEANGFESAEVVEDRLNILLQRDGRGKLLNSLIAESRFRGVTARRLLSIYRSHVPALELHAGALDLLEAANSISGGHTYLVTDGNRNVQKKKFAALGISDKFAKPFFTRDYGIRAEKPSHVVFDKIRIIEKCEMSDFIFIGDDPNKDFKYVVENGGYGIRIKQGRLAELESERINGPQFEVASVRNAQTLLESLY